MISCENDPCTTTAAISIGNTARGMRNKNKTAAVRSMYRKSKKGDTARDFRVIR